MNFMEFTYTKADGTTSKRAILPLLSPSKHIEGIDLTQLPENEFVQFCREFSALKSDHHNQVMEKLAKFDLTHNYRCFNPDKMSDVTSDYV